VSGAAFMAAVGSVRSGSGAGGGGWGGHRECGIWGGRFLCYRDEACAAVIACDAANTTAVLAFCVLLHLALFGSCYTILIGYTLYAIPIYL